MNEVNILIQNQHCSFTYNLYVGGLPLVLLLLVIAVSVCVVYIVNVDFVNAPDRFVPKNIDLNVFRLNVIIKIRHQIPDIRLGII